MLQMSHISGPSIQHQSNKKYMITKGSRYSVKVINAGNANCGVLLCIIYSRYMTYVCDICNALRIC